MAQDIRKIVVIALVVGGLALVILATWTRGKHNEGRVAAGAICSVDDGEGWFRFAKVLVVDDLAVHIRLYKPRFKDRPISVLDQDLILGSYKDPDGFGIGHLPLSRKAFEAWKPVVIRQAKVEPEELDGYRQWQESGGGVFGDQ